MDLLFKAMALNKPTFVHVLKNATRITITGMLGGGVLNPYSGKLGNREN